MSIETVSSTQVFEIVASNPKLHPSLLELLSDPHVGHATPWMVPGIIPAFSSRLTVPTFAEVMFMSSINKTVAPKATRPNSPNVNPRWARRTQA